MLLIFLWELLVISPSYYHISMTQINVGSNSSVLGVSAIFDTGASFTSLSDPAYTFISESVSSWKIVFHKIFWYFIDPTTLINMSIYDFHLLFSSILRSKKSGFLQILVSPLNIVMSWGDLYIYIQRNLFIYALYLLAFRLSSKVLRSAKFVYCSANQTTIYVPDTNLTMESGAVYSVSNPTVVISVQVWWSNY